jgi:hypothetical protein
MPKKKAKRQSFAPLPETVRVGYRTYKLNVMGEWESDRSHNYARIDHAAATIEFCAFLDPQKAANSLIHELMHAFWSIWAIGEDCVAHDKPQELNEEEVVIGLTNGLSTFMRDNAGLFQTLEDMLNCED